MLSYKSAVCYIPGEGERRLNDNYYFNSKVITEELSSSRIKLAQKSEKSGIQVFGICSGSFSPSYDGSAATSVVNCLKKYHAAILREPEADVKPLLKEFCREASFAVSTRKKEGVERKAAVAAVIAGDGVITVLNIGDVRVYRFDGNSVTVITEEHTQAHKMYEMGLLAENKIAFHPQRRKLTRYLGGSLEASAPAVTSFACGGGETYVILGSGANDCVNANLIKNVIKNNDSPAEIAAELAALCTDNEGEDRTVLVINTYGEPLAAVPAAVENTENNITEASEEDFFRNAVAADDVKNISEDVAAGVVAGVSAGGSIAAAAENGESFGAADGGEKVNLFEQLENSDEDAEEDGAAKEELFFNAAADGADEFSGVAFASAATDNDFEDEVVFGASASENSGDTESLEDDFDGGDEFDGAGIVKSNAKKTGAASGIGAAAKRFAAGGGDEEKEQIWPALVVFAVCLIFIILLCVFGIEMFKSGKDTQPAGDSTGVPFVTQTPSGDSTDLTSEAPVETGTSTETAAPVTDAPASATPPVVNTDDATAAPTATPTAKPTDAPATDAPATDVPATDAPVTEVPATDAPETEVPATDVPETEVPSTDVPATDVPETEVPATDVPATDVPESEAPSETAVPTETPTAEPPAETEAPTEEPSAESADGENA